MPSPTQTCTNCSKPQSTLPHPLKVCAKCHTQAYCSRTCQKSHWKTHKKTCGRIPSTPTPSSLTNPPKSEILAGATQTTTFMKLLANCDGFNPVLRDMPPTVAGLMYLCDFVQRTFREYWFPLLPQREATELMLSCASFFGKDEATEREGFQEGLRDMQRDHPDVFEGLGEWPGSVDVEKYGDARSRNWMAAKIVLDTQRQGMMGGVYEYPEEVRGLARRVLGEEEEEETPAGGDMGVGDDVD